MLLVRFINSFIAFNTIDKIMAHIICSYPDDVTTTFVLVWANKRYPQSATALLENLEYNHLRSGKYIDFFFPGYIDKSVSSDSSFNWEFSPSDFVESIKRIESESKWRYSGNTEFLFLEYRSGKVDYRHTISINIDQMLKYNIISSVPAFVEDIIRIAVSCTEVSEFADQLNLWEAKHSVRHSIWQYIIDKFKGIHVGTFRYKNLERK